MWRDPGTPADSFYQVRPECANDVPKTKFKIKLAAHVTCGPVAGRTLSVRKWQAAFTPDGYLDIGRTLGRIQRGGIHPSIRGEVWEFLLGCYDPKSTFDEREQIRQRRRFQPLACGASMYERLQAPVVVPHLRYAFVEAQYAVLKEECRLVFPLVGSGRFITAPVITDNGEPIQDPIVLLEASPEKDWLYFLKKMVMTTNLSLHFPQFSDSERGGQENNPMEAYTTSNRLVIHINDEWKLPSLDVVRTDRTLVFYEKQENLSKLWDILAVYAWFDTDVGYCQGMSDLCSPMIILLDDEADAFWCFERLMRRLRGNFRCTENSIGVEAQLSKLASITQVIDPKLHQHLGVPGEEIYVLILLGSCSMMWALEYDPDMFSVYEDPDSVTGKSEGSRGKAKSTRQCGKYERENMRSGAKDDVAPLPISVFLVAGVLKDRSTKLLTEARGLDDVVKEIALPEELALNIIGRLPMKSAVAVHEEVDMYISRGASSITPHSPISASAFAEEPIDENTFCAFVGRVLSLLVGPVRRFKLGAYNDIEPDVIAGWISEHLAENMFTGLRTLRMENNFDDMDFLGVNLFRRILSLHELYLDGSVLEDASVTIQIVLPQLERLEVTKRPPKLIHPGLYSKRRG
ncbi:hypothetical protein C3L33_09903, partial [Rhododendron williamsianum]